MRKKLDMVPRNKMFGEPSIDEWVGVKNVEKTTMEFYPGMHKKFKTACAENGYSMKDVMHKLINTYLREYGKE